MVVVEPSLMANKGYMNGSTSPNLQNENDWITPKALGVAQEVTKPLI